MDLAPLSPRQLLRKGPSPAITGILLLCLAFFLAAGAWLAFLGLSPGGTLTEHILLCTLAATVLLLPFRVAFVTLRRRLQQGHWIPDAEERLQNLAKVNPDSRLVAAVSSPWFDTALSSLFAYNVWLAIRHGHEPLSHFNQALTGIWAILTAQSLWSLYRKLYRRPA